MDFATQKTGLKHRFPATALLARLRNHVNHLTDTAPQWNFLQLVLLVQLLIFLDLGELFKTIRGPPQTEQLRFVYLS